MTIRGDMDVAIPHMLKDTQYMNIMIDKDGTEWKITWHDSRSRTLVERKISDRWICGVFYDGDIHEVEEGCHLGTNSPREWTATLKYGWLPMVRLIKR